MLSIPRMDDPNLAYETGVHLGDGSLSEQRYVISGNKQNETQYYENVLAPLIESLYSLAPTVAFQCNSVYSRVYSKELVSFKHSVLGLPIGRKLDLHIPACVCSNVPCAASVTSGLDDADGSVKNRRDKSGDYPRISLGQKHMELVAEVKRILQRFGITSTMYRNDYADPRNGKVETRWFLDINGFSNFERFVSIIGTRSSYVKNKIEAVEAVR